jgi:hypothetical protein
MAKKRYSIRIICYDRNKPVIVITFQKYESGMTLPERPHFAPKSHELSVTKQDKRWPKKYCPEWE